MSPYDDIIQNETEMIRRGLAPLVQHGNNQVELAALELRRQRDLEDVAQKNMFTQQMLDRQHLFQGLRDESQQRQSMALLREQGRLVAQRQEAEDERGYRKQVEAEAFRYGVDTKGRSIEEITRLVDAKIAANVKSDVDKRESIAKQIVQLTQNSSLAAKRRITEMALNNPALVATMDPKTVAALKTGAITVDQVINKRQADFWPYIGRLTGVFGTGRVSANQDASAMYSMYASALKEAAERDKDLNPDYPLAIKLSNLNSDLSILDKNIAEQYGRIKNVDLAKGIFGTPAAATPPAPSNPFKFSVPVPGGFPIGVAPAANPLGGILLPPPKPLAGPVPVPVSPSGAVIPAQSGGYSPYIQEYPAREYPNSP